LVVDARAEKELLSETPPPGGRRIGSGGRVESPDGTQAGVPIAPASPLLIVVCVVGGHSWAANYVIASLTCR
jgi:hypothetical protein